MFSIPDETQKWFFAQNLPCQFFESTLSTNTEAKNQIAQQTERQLFFLARKQTAGRGRGANTWLSNEVDNALYATWSFKLADAPQAITAPRLGLTFFQAMKAALPTAALALKAPNDIYLGQKKIAGLLTETVAYSGHFFLIVGFGLNVFSYPKNIPLAGQWINNEEFFKENWSQFLDQLQNRWNITLQEVINSKLTLQTRDELLEALNAFAGLEEKYLKVSEVGDLILPQRSVSWRDL